MLTEIFSGDFGGGLIFPAIIITAAAVIAVLFSVLFTKAFSKNEFPFLKTLFSFSSLLSVLSALFFNIAVFNIRNSEERRNTAKTAFFTWFTVFLLSVITAFVSPLFLAAELLAVSGVLFATATVNLLPLPGLLCFSVLKGIFPERLAGKMEAAEKYKVFFIVFILLIMQRSGLSSLLSSFVF